MTARPSQQEKFFVHTRAGRRGPFSAIQLLAFVETGKLPDHVRVFSSVDGRGVRVAEVVSGIRGAPARPRSPGRARTVSRPRPALAARGRPLARTASRMRHGRRAEGRVRRRSPTVPIVIVIGFCLFTMVGFLYFSGSAGRSGREFSASAALGYGLGSATLNTAIVGIIAGLIGLCCGRRARVTVFLVLFGIGSGLLGLGILLATAGGEGVPPASSSPPKALTFLEGRAQISLPHGWQQTTGVNDDAQLQLARWRLGAIFLVFVEPKSAGSEGITLERYSEIFRAIFSDQAVDYRELAGPERTSVNGLPAIRHVIGVRVENRDVQYSATVLEGPEHFYRLVGGCVVVHFNRARPDLERLVNSFVVR